MKAIRKLVLCLTFIFASLFSFADDWCIYLGSFKNKANAEKRMSVLKAESIKTSISEYKDPKGNVFYRVVWDEHFDSLESVRLHKTMLSYLPVIKKEKISDIWFEKIVPPKSDVKESVPEKNVPAESVPETDENVVDPEDVAENEPDDLESEDSEPVLREPTLMSLIDSETGLPLENAVLSIDGGKWEIEIDAEGKILMPGDIPDGEYPYTVTSEEDGRTIIEGQLGLRGGLVVSDKRNKVESIER